MIISQNEKWKMIISKWNDEKWKMIIEKWKLKNENWKMKIEKWNDERNTSVSTVPNWIFTQNFV